MNKTLLAGGLAALILAAATGAAVAQQPSAPSHVRAMRADVDGDQRLSQAEFVDRRLHRLTAADSDGDGSVTRDELQAHARDRVARRADARFDQLDANDDGAISKAEFDARRDHRAEARAEGGPRAHRGHWRRASRARGGREARGPVVIADARTRAEAAFARLDVDHDGYVTAGERRAVRAGMREQRRERMAERRAARRAQQASPPTAASE